MSTEYPALTRRFFAERGIEADVRLSYGATEAKVPDIVDCVVDGTETGRALRAAGLKIIGEILPSYTELIANPDAYADPAKRHAMDQLKMLLDGVLEARGKVLVKLNVGRADLDAVIGLVPSMKAPTVSELFGEGGLRGRDGGGQGRDQHAHPGAQGRRRHRHHRAAAVEDRALMLAAPFSESTGTVDTFDEAAGCGTVRSDDGAVLSFHCTAVADGSRTIAVGQPVRFTIVAGRLGRWEASHIVNL